MGFLDAILGTSKLPKPKIEGLYAFSTAYVTLNTNLGLKNTNNAGICFKPIEASSFQEARKDIEELLSLSCKETNTKYNIQIDSYNYTWIVLRDPDFEDLVSTLYLVSGALLDHGFGEQLLCAVFKFQGEKIVYWIYNFKEGKTYPFVPLEGKKRDTAFEFRLSAVMEKELSVEKDLQKWYPMWDIPI